MDSRNKKARLCPVWTLASLRLPGLGGGESFAACFVVPRALPSLLPERLWNLRALNGFEPASEVLDVGEEFFGRDPTLRFSMRISNTVSWLCIVENHMTETSFPIRQHRLRDKRQSQAQSTTEFT